MLVDLTPAEVDFLLDCMNYRLDDVFYECQFHTGTAHEDYKKECDAVQAMVETLWPKLQKEALVC
jgi:hypothetical protein